MKKLSLLLLTLALLTTLLGCASSSAPAEAAKSEPAATESMMDNMEAPMDTEEESLEATVATNTQVDFSEKIIYSASVSVETTNFDQATDAVTKLVADCGGFLENSSTYGNPIYKADGSTQVVDRSAYFTIRVPSANYEATLNQAGTIGNVVSCDQSAQNVTSQFMDMEAHVEALEVQQDRLLELLAKADDVDTLVTLEARLSEVSYEINTIQRQLNNMQMDVDYSTIDLNIQEVEVYTPTATAQRSFGEKLGDAFGDGLRNFVAWLEFFTLGFVSNIIGLIVFAGVVVGIVVIIKRIRKSKKKIDD